MCAITYPMKELVMGYVMWDGGWEVKHTVGGKEA